MKILNVIAILLFLISTIGACSAIHSSDAEPVWIHLDGEWVEAPKDVGPRGFRGAPVTVVEFVDDGKFLMMQCWINDYRDGRYMISIGDPYLVFVGNWIHLDGRRSVTYELRQVSHTARPEEFAGTRSAEAAIHSSTMQFMDKNFAPLNGSILNLDDFKSRYLSP